MFAQQVQEALTTVLPIAGGVLASLFIAIAVMQKFLSVCAPNKVLIFSGRKRVSDDGRSVGFRVVKGGRGFRWPIVETVDELDMTNISVPMTVSGAYAEGPGETLGIPITVHAVANVKVSSDDRYIGNAIERFLGRGRDEIAMVAKETLEGHLRGVVAKMTPEEVNEDRLKFTRSLQEEAEEDLQKLGLHLDTLNIQHVGDDRNYLESIGRERIAQVLRAAEVAESDAQREAKEEEARARARAEVAQTRAHAAIAQKENELRQIKADLDARARSEEEIALAAAQEARANAEKELQRIRGQLEQLRLEADVTIPAEVKRRVEELHAAGEAASIAEDGRAMAKALNVVAEAWRETEGRAMDMYVLQNLEEIFDKVADAAQNLKVREVNLVDGGDGQTMPNYLAAYPATVTKLLGEVSQSLGVDIPAIIRGDAAGQGPTPPLLPAATTPSAPSQTGGKSW